MSCRIAVCDDNPIDASYVETLLNAWADERGVFILVEIFPSAEAFLFCFEEDKTFDFLLLDIEMGAMDGVTLAKRPCSWCLLAVTGIILGRDMMCLPFIIF